MARLKLVEASSQLLSALAGSGPSRYMLRGLLIAELSLRREQASMHTSATQALQRDGSAMHVSVFLAAICTRWP